MTSAGGREGKKSRPCAIVLVTHDEDGDTLVYVVPITHTRPSDEEGAIELPPDAKRRLGLDRARSWIITSELNRFIWPGYDLRPISRDKPDTFAWGFLPVETFVVVKEAVWRAARRQRLTIVARD